MSHIAARPTNSFFGFPHSVGWKVIGDLYAQGVLNGDYFSNEEELITGWYTRGAYRCEYDPAYYFLASRPLDPIRLDEEQIRKTYYPFGRVLVDGNMRIEIYSRAPLEQPTQTFDLRAHGDAYDRWQQFDFSLWDALAVSVPQYSAQFTWQQGPQLVGYDVGRKQLAIGQTTFVSLYWNISAQMAQVYNVQLEVRDAQGRNVGEVQPYCHKQEGDWYRSAPSELGFIVTAGTQMPPGTYTLHASLRSHDGGPALPLLDGSADATLATLTVLPTEQVPAGWTPVEKPLATNFGPNLHLRSAARATTESGARWLRYRLFWTARDAPKRDYMMFAHLLATDGTRVAQVDLPLATSGWQAQQLYTTMLSLPLPPDLPPGDYRLFMGVYNPETGERLPLSAADPGDGAAGADALLLSTVRLP